MRNDEKDIKTLTPVSAKSYSLKVYKTRDEMGRAAAVCDYEMLASWVESGVKPCLILAAAASQNERAYYLSRLLADNPHVRDKCIYFHMDENIAPDGDVMSLDNPASFAYWLNENYIKAASIPRDRFKLVCDCGAEPGNAARAYSEMLKIVFEADKSAIAVLGGIGVTGHFAYCDPGTKAACMNADNLVDIVELDNITRLQQLTDFPYDPDTGAGFRSIDEVQTHAVTLTMKALTYTKIKYISMTVPNGEKAISLRNFWYGNPENYEFSSVASAVKTIPGVSINVFVDTAAAEFID